MRDPLDLFHAPVRAWFRASFPGPTRPQRLGWPVIARGDSALILAPTGSGKTLAAFLSCLDRLMFGSVPERGDRCRVVYVSPLKALAADVDRNLRQPLAGIAAAAAGEGMPCHEPAIAVRTGDTPTSDRARFLREPADILITTPESLFLILTSSARERLRSVETVIVDEVHALLASKRGAHLALSLERLERTAGRRLQRIGLSATVRPLEEAARFLGGCHPAGAPVERPGGREARAPTERDLIDDEFSAPGRVRYRDVTIVDAREVKRLDVRIELPVEHMLGAPGSGVADAPAGAPEARSLWAALHPRVLELVRSHRATLIFVNSRRLAERLAGALNELAGEPLVRAHHGSLARAQRVEIEELLKAGRLRGLVATSSLELGIDMGAIDLVVQIEAPPSVSSALQRIGRAGHRVGEPSAGILFPKFRGDLLACAAIGAGVRAQQTEPSRYPRNALDVLAQQIVAMASVDAWNADELFSAVRGAAPYAELRRSVFDGVLDMLSGRYPSDAFAELRPRLTWDRARNIVTARQGARAIAIANAGTIPDRGLYGVFLLGAERERARVGELDEEMVFEARVGETFLLGASTWRIEEITHDRVIVSAAPGEPGKMPFWRGETGSRPLDLGLAIGRLARELAHQRPEAARRRLERDHGLASGAAESLVRYLDDQQRAAGAVPDDRTLLVERLRDEMGDWRVLILSPFGSRVHAPWAMAIAARAESATGRRADTMWSDDGIVVRLPESAEPPGIDILIPDPEGVEHDILRHVGTTALFAARFREAAGRALLLPRRRPGARAPLWQQRRRAADLLAAAARYGSFPIVLETYRELLHDLFDLRALVDLLGRARSGSMRVVVVDSERPSPFGASLLFNYAANYIYEGDAPLAERRAQALSIDPSQLQELIGEPELRDLLDPHAIESVERERQRLTPELAARSTDAVHDLLLRLGDLTRNEIEVRSAPGIASSAIAALVIAGRALEIPIAGEPRLIAVEHAARYRDGLGALLPPDLPAAFLEPSPDPLGDLLRRYARTHGPFAAADPAVRFGLPVSSIDDALTRLAARGELVEGAFCPGGHGREWCDPDVLRTIRRRSLARLRRDVEPVDPHVLGRFLPDWHAIGRARAGAEALLEAIAQLQGVPLVASTLEEEILPARVADYSPALLDTLLASGEVAWVGLEPLGERDGRIALFLADHLGDLLSPRPVPATTSAENELLRILQSRGASFFEALHAARGGGFPTETVETLWSLVWKGLVTNDTLHALRAYLRRPDRTRHPARDGIRHVRRSVPPAAEGRWAALAPNPQRSMTEWATCAARQLLARHGVVAREVASIEQLPGGFGAIYPVLRRLEETGRIRQGYFVAGPSAAQFALPEAIDRLRAARDEPEAPLVVTLAATDPANPYGALLPWPDRPTTPRPSRSAGARVILVDGRLTAWIARGDRMMFVALPPDEAERARAGRALAHELVALAHRAPEERRGWLIEEINGQPAALDQAAAFLVEAGFVSTALGLQLRVPKSSPPAGNRVNAG